jgi:hypothetical protein
MQVPNLISGLENHRHVELEPTALGKTFVQLICSMTLEKVFKNASLSAASS